MKEAIQILILITPPIAYKLYKDRRGFDHSKPNIEIDFTAAIIVIDAGLMNAFISPPIHWLFFIKCVTVSITGFALFFPPLFNLLWWEKSSITKVIWINALDRTKWSYIFNHMSNVAIPDRWEWYRKVGPFVRIGFYLVLFSLSIIWYV